MASDANIPCVDAVSKPPHTVYPRGSSYEGKATGAYNYHSPLSSH